MKKQISMFYKMLDLLVDLTLEESVVFAIYVCERLAQLPKTGTLDEVKEIAVLHQEWYNICIPILEATRYATEVISETDRLRELSVNVGEARFHEIVETIEDSVRRWNNAAEKTSDTLKERMAIAHVT